MRTPIAAIVFGLGFAALPACGAPVDSVVTDACQVIDWVKQDETGATLPKAQWYPGTHRCAGPGGWYAFFNEEGEHQGIGFARIANKPPVPYAILPHWGEALHRVEWRGPQAKPFRPTAAVLRFTWHSDDAASVKRQALAVARLGADAASTCIFAFVDARLPQAYDKADELADREAGGADCEANEPRFFGLEGFAR